MQLVKLILSGIETSKQRLLAMIIISGISNSAIITIVNAGADQAHRSAHEIRLILMLFTCIGAYALSQRFIMVVASGEFETIIHRLRTRLIDKILRCDLLQIEATGRSSLQAGLGKETQTLSQFATPMVLASQAIVLSVFSLAYIAWLSVPNFLLCIFYLAVTFSLYFRRTSRINENLHHAMRRENDLQDTLTDLLDGFKELKMNGGRRAAIQKAANAISEESSWLRIASQASLARNFVFTQSAFFLLLAASVFLVPALASHADSHTAAKTITAILFLSGPISGLVACVPAFANANAAAENIVDLEDTLDQLLDQSEQPDIDTTVNSPFPPPFPLPFTEIKLDGVLFTHGESSNGQGFVVGPIDLTIRAGEITFITGGNGSGKSTLLKLLTALYAPQAGVILVDGVPVTRVHAQAYRNLFASVFSDYHLFSRLYDMKLPDAATVTQQLDAFELSEKTSFDSDRFRNKDLSAGQRRRLALMTAMFEEKQIYVLDEWAADQDPNFRRKFYHEILPSLKARRCTVVAVTHDDRYFDVCDNHVRMDEGKLTLVKTSAKNV